MIRSRTLAALLKVLLVATLVPAAGCDAARPMAGKGTRSMEAKTLLADCAPRSAVLHLVNEDLLTRTAITAETIGRYAKVTTLDAGNARLQQLDAALKGLDLAPASAPKFEIRFMVELTCADGSRRRVLGSKSHEGRVELDIDGRTASSGAALRRTLDDLAG